MSSCLSGGGRAYRLDLQLIKSPSTSWSSHSSSPSSESTNSSVTITTRKPRTPRKRPNQSYNEAAAILSTAYPTIFSTKHLTKHGKFTTPRNTFAYQVQDLLIPLQARKNDQLYEGKIEANLSPRVVGNSCKSEFLLQKHRIEKNNVCNESKMVSSFERQCQSPVRINSNENFLNFFDEFQEDYDAESILDEEIEEGIDSIMGDITTTNNNNESMEESKNGLSYTTQVMNMDTCYGYPVGMGYYGNNVINKAFRNASDEWRFSRVNVTDITPELNNITSDKKKKKKKVEKYGRGNSSGLREAKGEDTLIKKVPKNRSRPFSCKTVADAHSSIYNPSDEEANDTNHRSSSYLPYQKKISIDTPKPNAGLKLKLNYDVVLNAWSNRSTPLPDELLRLKGSANDVEARLSKIDLFTHEGGLKEGSVSCYKEKIKYQVGKGNDDQQPKMKVRGPDSPDGDTNEDIDITTCD